MLKSFAEMNARCYFKIFILCWFIGVGVKGKGVDHGVMDTSHRRDAKRVDVRDEDEHKGKGKDEDEDEGEGEGEGEKEYLESDIRIILLNHLRRLGLDAYIVSDKEVEEGSYYSYYFTSSPRVVTSVCCIKVNGMNFDCINLLVRG